MGLMVIGFCVSVIVLFIFLALSKMIVIIGGTEIGIVEKKYIGKKLPSNRVVALKGEIGVQARTLGPGLHLFFPFLYAVHKQGFIKVSENQLGFVEAIDGTPLEPGRIMAISAPSHDHYQDGEAFLKNGGQKGPQCEIIPPGVYRINTYLFNVAVIDATVISSGEIGIISAIDGVPMDAGRLLAKSVPNHNNYQNGEEFLKNGGQKGPQMDVLLPGVYRINTRMFDVRKVDACKISSGRVGIITANDGEKLPDHELVARSVEGHDSYQNASAFLKNGGQRGPQLGVLTPGVYYINPSMFSVSQDDALTVEQGQVAVIISNIGKEPDVSPAEVQEANNASQNLSEKNRFERYVVSQGYRGIQREVLGPGNYYINKIAYRPVIVNTTNTTIDWDDSEDTKFDTLSVVSKDGFELKVGVKVVIRVQPEQAPFMVARIGSIENLITNVIHPLIDSSFRNQASTASAMQFLQNRHEQQELALARAVSELSMYHVEVLSVLICQITLPTELMETQTNKVLAEQRQEMFKAQQLSENIRIATEKTKAEADKQATLVSAQIDVKVADQTKEKTITLAKGEAEKIRLEGDAEATKILAIGKATAEAYELTKKAVSPDGLVSIEMMKLIAANNIKITPEILINGNGSDTSGSMVNAILAKLMKKDISVPQIVAQQAAATTETKAKTE